MLLLEPGAVAGLKVPNRIVRSATCEAMATDAGEVTPHLIELHRKLAEGHVGATVLGHAYVHARGQASRHQTGIHDDSLVPGLARLVDAVHQQGGLVFAQLAHAGSQSKIASTTKLAPSPVPNALLGVMPKQASEEEIHEVIAAFGSAARRAVAAGFDAVEIHAANGYLISEFSSPFANRRDDQWGGDAVRRSAFITAVYDAVREAVGSSFPVLLKLGMVDMVNGGLGLDESLERLASLRARGLDGAQISCGVMSSGADSCHTYVAVDTKRAVRDVLPWRLLSPPAPEAYWAPWAQAVRARIPGLPIMLVGGMRSVAVMEQLLAAGTCDFVCIGRPLVREPDFVLQVERCRKDYLECTSCNLCLIHDGYNELQCWRTPKGRLLQAAYMRFTGQLH
jgi:2,4-dienoyl-CoA reductase-like NADH-dependent reductase (Old Yellow Enzyme family)